MTGIWMVNASESVKQLRFEARSRRSVRQIGTRLDDVRKDRQCFKAIIVVWLALLVLTLYIFTSVTRIIENVGQRLHHTVRRRRALLYRHQAVFCREKQDDSLNAGRTSTHFRCLAI